jgi:uncharacterized protein YegP (UPF0339 family)
MKIKLFARKNWHGRRLHYFRICADNGEPVVQSEGYSRHVDALATARLLKSKLGEAEIVNA